MCNCETIFFDLQHITTKTTATATEMVLMHWCRVRHTDAINVRKPLKLNPGETRQNEDEVRRNEAKFTEKRIYQQQQQLKKWLVESIEKKWVSSEWYRKLIAKRKTWSANGSRLSQLAINITNRTEPYTRWANLYCTVRAFSFSCDFTGFKLRHGCNVEPFNCVSVRVWAYRT